MREARTRELSYTRALTLYLDQSDVSDLALRRDDAMATLRSRLRWLADDGVVRLRVSLAHFVESPRLSFRRTASIFRFLADMPGTVFAGTMPGDVFRAELNDDRVDLQDRPVAELGALSRLRIACLAIVATSYAYTIADTKEQTRKWLRRFHVQPPQQRSRPQIDMPSHALSHALRTAVERNLRRKTDRSDVLDEMHLTYAAHSDIATVDGFVFDATKKVRRHLGDRTRWIRTGRIDEVLDHLEFHRRAM